MDKKTKAKVEKKTRVPKTPKEKQPRVKKDKTTKKTVAPITPHTTILPPSAMPPAIQAAVDSATTVSMVPVPAAQEAVEEEEELEDDDVVAKPSQSIGREETKALLDQMDEETLNRYEAFRRAHLPKSTMRKIVTTIVGPVPASVAIVVSGVGKIFVGEIVETALDVMEEWGHTGPICPEHLREAFKRYQKDHGTVKNKGYTRQIF